MAELSAVPFSALPTSDDGYTLLNDNGIVHRSSKKLSELVGEKTSSFLTKEEGDTLYQEKGDYLVDDDISGKLDKSESANFYPMTGNPSRFLTEHQSLDEYATINYVDTEIGKIGSFEVVDLNEENEPNVNEPSTKIIYLTKEIDSEKSDPYTEWIYNDTTSAFECIGETTLDLANYYKKNETSGAAEISAALASNSWKRISEQFGSKNTYEDSDSDKLSVYIGQNNSANSPDSYTLGRNNNSEQGVNVGYYNIIDVNYQEFVPGDFNFGKSNVISGSPGGVNLGQYNSAHSWGVNLGERNIGFNGGYNFGISNSANNGSINIGGKNICFDGGYNFGSANSSNQGSINIGENNTATIGSYNIGRYNNTINGYTFGYNNSTNMGFSIGQYNSANDAGYAFGDNNTASNASYSIGKRNNAIIGSFVFGDTNKATSGGFIFGRNNNSFDGFIFGEYLSAFNGSIAIGYTSTVFYGSIAIGARNYANNGSFILGNTNTATKGTTIIGDDNIATYTDIIGNRNKINQNILNNPSFSSETYIKDTATNEIVHIKNFVAGLDNSADYAKNAYILGNKNEIISDSADYINGNNDGYTFIYGWHNSANRNYDMAIGYKAIASGGENIAIGTPQKINSTSTATLETKAIGYKNLAIRSDISGIGNIAIDSYVSNSYTAHPLYGNCGNFYRNTKLNFNCTNDFQNNIFYNVFNNITGLSAHQITNNLFFDVNDGNGITASVICHNRIKNINNTNLSATLDLSENDIVDFTNSNLSFSERISHNTFNHNGNLSISGVECYNNTVTLTVGTANLNSFSNNFVYNTTLVGKIKSNGLMDNFIFGSELHLQNSNSGIFKNYPGIWKSISLGSTIYGNSYNSVSIAYDDNIKSDYESDSSHIEDVNKTFNWGNNFIKNTSETVVFGSKNSAINTDYCNIHGQGNSLYCSVQSGYFVQDQCMHHCEVNGSWNIISNISGDGKSVDYNKIIGDGNAIIVNFDTTNNKYYATRNTLVGDWNQLLSIPRANIDEIVNGRTSLQNIVYDRATIVPSTLRELANYQSNKISELSAFATHDSDRNTILGSKNVISNNINDSIILGHGNGIYNDLNYSVNTDIILGQCNLAVNGSNDFIAGDNIVASGHQTTAIGDTLISNASQIIIGKFNAPVDAAVRDGIAWNETTSAVEPLTQSGVIFAIGNGTYNVTTGITAYVDGSPKTAYVDASGNKLGSKPLVSEEYITRSNAMIVSADGTVSATRFATSGIADLEAKIKELENIIETYSAKWVLTNN